MPVALWRTGLLLSFLTFCACQGKLTVWSCRLDTEISTITVTYQWFTCVYMCCFSSLHTEEDCVLGIVGRPVSLPCFYPELFTFVNYSIEWRRDDEVVLRSKWETDGRNVEKWSTDSATVSADAALSGNLTLSLTTVDPKEDKTYYSLFIISGGNQSAPICTVCLRTAGQCLTHRK